MTDWFRFSVALAIFPASSLLLGCAGSSGIQTMIHKSPDSVVYLEWVPEESFRASHPATLSPKIIQRSLRGVLIQAPPGLLDDMLGKEEPKPSHMFSHFDVELLVPHIVSALSQATPEEHVVFRRIYDLESSTRPTEGKLHVQDDLLHITFTHYGLKTRQVLIVFKEGGDRHMPDYSGLKGSKVLFTPKTAWRHDVVPDKAPPDSPHAKTVALDYKVLASLPAEPLYMPHKAGSDSRTVHEPSQPHDPKPVNEMSETTDRDTQNALDREQAQPSEQDPKFKDLEERIRILEQELERRKTKP